MQAAGGCRQRGWALTGGAALVNLCRKPTVGVRPQPTRPGPCPASAPTAHVDTQPHPRPSCHSSSEAELPRG